MPLKYDRFLRRQTRRSKIPQFLLRIPDPITPSSYFLDSWQFRIDASASNWFFFGLWFWTWFCSYDTIEISSMQKLLILGTLFWSSELSHSMTAYNSLSKTFWIAKASLRLCQVWVSVLHRASNRSIVWLNSEPYHDSLSGTYLQLLLKIVWIGFAMAHVCHNTIYGWVHRVTRPDQAF